MAAALWQRQGDTWVVGWKGGVELEIGGQNLRLGDLGATEELIRPTMLREKARCPPSAVC